MLAGAAVLLDRAGHVPLYRQIERILRDELAGGDGALAHRLTENQLMGRFHVSRHTVRQALARLSAAGLIERRPRRGTFVRIGLPLEQPLSGVYSFVRSLQDLGLPYQVRVASVRRAQTDDRTREHLGPATVAEVQRLHNIADEPLVAETIWLAGERVPDIEALDLTGSLYELLQQRYGLRVTSAREFIRPVVLDRRESLLLGVEPGCPAFFVERVSFVHDQPIEVRHSLIRGDRYLYSVQLQASPDELSA
jgi:GntR family transcriptional regulator